MQDPTDAQILATIDGEPPSIRALMRAHGIGQTRATRIHRAATERHDRPAAGAARPAADQPPAQPQTRRPIPTRDDTAEQPNDDPEQPQSPQQNPRPTTDVTEPQNDAQRTTESQPTTEQELTEQHQTREIQNNTSKINKEDEKNQDRLKSEETQEDQNDYPDPCITTESAKNKINKE